MFGGTPNTACEDTCAPQKERLWFLALEGGIETGAAWSAVVGFDSRSRRLVSTRKKSSLERQRGYTSTAIFLADERERALIRRKSCSGPCEEFWHRK
jgi:hypothetical protein